MRKNSLSTATQSRVLFPNISVIENNRPDIVSEYGHIHNPFILFMKDFICYTVGSVPIDYNRTQLSFLFASTSHIFRNNDPESSLIFNRENSLTSNHINTLQHKPT